jgi:hypothetical protein
MKLSLTALVTLAARRPWPVRRDAVERGYQVLGLDAAAGGDHVFWQLVLARIIEPARARLSQRAPWANAAGIGQHA